MPSDYPLPANVKEVLSRLPVKDQVVLRSYIAGLRDQVIEHKVAAERAADPEDDGHAHYHGHEKCTADHGHDDAHHGKAEDSHEHGHDHGKSCDAHEHGHDHGKSCDEKHDDHSHEHGHKEHKEEHKEHSHEHKHKEHEEHKEHSHEHGHDHKGDCDHKKDEEKKEEMPAWKKRALEEGGDANAAPFGGSWNTETKVSAMDTSK